MTTLSVTINISKDVINTTVSQLFRTNIYVTIIRLCKVILFQIYLQNARQFTFKNKVNVIDIFLINVKLWF